MTTPHRPLIIIILALIIGAMLGTLLGDLLGMILPPGVVKELFLRSVAVSLNPTTLDLLVLKFTLGFSLKLNFSGIIGLGVAYYLLRYFR